MARKRHSDEDALKLLREIDAPVAVDDFATLTQDTSVLVDIFANDFDVDGDMLLFSGLGFASNGFIGIDGTQVYCTLNARFTGTDRTTYTVTENNGGEDTATVFFTVEASNANPAANGNTASVDEDSSVLIDVLINDTDGDRDTLTLTGVTGAVNGTAMLEGNQVRYTSNADFNGSETLSYTISDGNGGSDTGVINVTINAVNDAPLALDDSATLSEDGDVLVDVLANDSDPDGDALTLDSVGAPANGTVVIEGDQLRYTPDLGFSGTDNVTYTVSDGNGGTDTGTVTFTVEPSVRGPAPIGESGSITVSQSGPNQWHTVTFAAALTDAVVVLGPLSSNESEMATTRAQCHRHRL